MRIISHATTPSDFRDEIVAELRRCAATKRHASALQATKRLRMSYEDQAHALCAQADFFADIIFQPKQL